MFPDVRISGFDLYTIFFALGIIAGLGILYLFGKKKQIPENILIYYILLAVISISSGYLFAILFQAIYDFIKNGVLEFSGITFLGGLVGGGATFLVIYLLTAKPEERKYFKTVMAIAPISITLGHFFGRLGCFAVGSCHGKVTTGIFGMRFRTAEVIYGVGVKVYPTQLFEAAFLLVLFIALSYLLFKKKKENTLPIYLVSYGLFRFFIEFYRGDDRGELIPGLSPSQALSIVLFIIGTVILIKPLMRKQKLSDVNKVKEIYMKNIKMNKKTIAIGSIVLLAIISLVLFMSKYDKERNDFLQSYGLEGLTVKEMVVKLDQEINEPSILKASINGKKLILKDDEKSYEFNLPTNKFYLSFAPYVEQTHPCANHNLITCRGELPDEVFMVTITDYTGNKLVNEEIKTGENGFIGLWLPKNITGTIEVRYAGKTAKADFSTFETNNTCLTTPLQLK
jgi:prolipoprotein diacylglyceryltransferase